MRVTYLIRKGPDWQDANVSLFKDFGLFGCEEQCCLQKVLPRQLE